MKNALILMLGLVVSTASFATPTDQSMPSANLVVTKDHGIKLTISPEEARGLVILRDFDGHVLYTSQAGLSYKTICWVRN